MFYGRDQQIRLRFLKQRLRFVLAHRRESGKYRAKSVGSSTEVLFTPSYLSHNIHTNAATHRCLRFNLPPPQKRERRSRGNERQSPLRLLEAVSPAVNTEYDTDDVTQLFGVLKCSGAESED